ncbi:DMT family transporter [Psychrobacillus lasiicapitis]|uniref:EamA/RhaT family transporter n=1 Tax=Psychrobacillus lasiicapitis TaxID=1636719 RepID=A0A544TCD6_9BACI|nr:DMT family transporter [Psychrobacillus lasiicapitis]TQR15069.1 EamA/RhaT family transporter [Psychrobacillus lasiicapitis]GGA22192.1 membrane protein [Psychrobacillus lasiicapitis]
MGRWKGIVLIVFGSMLWGATGPMMEWVFKNSALSVSFFLTVRLIIAGVGLLAYLKIIGKPIFSIWKEQSWLKQLIIFGIFGMLGVQYTFVAAIEASNASIATLLQFLGPIYIVIFVSWKSKMFPPRYQIIGIIGTLIGLFFLLTNAKVDQLLISNEALIWGLAIGVAFAIYTVYPARLMKEWGVLIIVGWGMLIGGVVLALISQIWRSDEWGELTNYPINLMSFIIILVGTIAFILFLTSMKYISPIETSILSSMEPLTAMVISVIWLGQVFGAWQYVGVVVMIVFVTWLSIAGEIKWKRKEKMAN